MSFASCWRLKVTSSCPPISNLFLNNIFVMLIDRALLIGAYQRLLINKVSFGRINMMIMTFFLLRIFIALCFVVKLSRYEWINQWGIPFKKVIIILVLINFEYLSNDDWEWISTSDINHSLISEKGESVRSNEIP